MELMDKTKGIFIAGMLAIYGCGASPNVNAERSTFSRDLTRPTPPPVEGVEIVDDGPRVSAVNKRVTGTSCTVQAWDPAPTEENAINLMKAQAAEMGFNRVHSVSVKRDPRAFLMNCWRAITATGIGFRAAE
ncbi:hypothetical protein ACLB6G_20470 [Zhengella sp. ZM62]|uniref:hypothetical protein n=1 Tax=Zhengella sedimenti TaxID=3390035 RepID=UPI0039758C7B